MWTYSLEAIPFISDFWKGLSMFSKSPRLAAASKILAGGSVEYLTETVLQEYPQGLAEKAIMNDRDAMTYIGEQVSKVKQYVFGNGVYASDAEKKEVEAAYKGFKETAITTGPTFLFGAGGATRGALKEYNEQASIKKEGLAYYQKYVVGEDEVIDFETIINEVAFLRNRWLGILKGLDTKQWQMGHIVRLRTAGMEDITV
jgi:hypothetical protein